MAITQERMIALIEAAKWFRDEHRNLVGLIRGIIGRDGVDVELAQALVSRAHTVQEPASHAETIMAEDVHYKHVGRKNELARQRQKLAQRQALGLDLDIPPTPRRHYPTTIEHPIDRRPPTRYAPSLHQSRPMEAINRLNEDEQLEYEAIKAGKSLTPQEQQAWARANGYSEPGFNPILADQKAGQIPEMKFTRMERDDD